MMGGNLLKRELFMKGAGASFTREGKGCQVLGEVCTPSLFFGKKVVYLPLGGKAVEGVGNHPPPPLGKDVQGWKKGYNVDFSVGEKKSSKGKKSLERS